MRQCPYRAVPCRVINHHGTCAGRRRPVSRQLAATSVDMGGKHRLSIQRRRSHPARIDLQHKPFPRGIDDEIHAAYSSEVQTPDQAIQYRDHLYAYGCRQPSVTAGDGAGITIIAVAERRRQQTIKSHAAGLPAIGKKNHGPTLPPHPALQIPSGIGGAACMITHI